MCIMYNQRAFQSQSAYNQQVFEKEKTWFYSNRSNIVSLVCHICSPFIYIVLFFDAFCTKCQIFVSVCCKYAVSISVSSSFSKATYRFIYVLWIFLYILTSSVVSKFTLWVSWVSYLHLIQIGLINLENENSVKRLVEKTQSKFQVSD